MSAVELGRARSNARARLVAVLFALAIGACGGRTPDDTGPPDAKCSGARASSWAVAVGDGHQPRARLAATASGTYVVAGGRVGGTVCGFTSGSETAPGYLAFYDAAGRPSWLRRFWPVTEKTGLVAVGGDALLLTDVSTGDDLGQGPVEQGLVLARFAPDGDVRWIRHVGATDDVKTARVSASPNGELIALYGVCAQKPGRPRCASSAESYVDVRSKDGSRIGLAVFSSKDSPTPIDLDAVAVGSNSSLVVVGRAPLGGIRVNASPYQMVGPESPAVFVAEIGASGEAVRVAFWQDRVVPRGAAFAGDILIVGGDAGEATALAGEPISGAWLAGVGDLTPKWVRSAGGSVTFGHLAADRLGAVASMRAAEPVSVSGVSVSAGAFFTMATSTGGAGGAVKQMPPMNVDAIGLQEPTDLAMIGTPRETVTIGSSSVSPGVVALLRMPWTR